jgi:hypothetical protein
MRVLGIDPGLAACGYGVVEIEGRRAVAVEFGCWHTASTTPLGRRLAELFTKVEAVISEQLPDAVAVEESFVGRDPRVALAVGQVRGAVLVAPFPPTSPDDLARLAARTNAGPKDVRHRWKRITRPPWRGPTSANTRLKPAPR